MSIRLMSQVWMLDLPGHLKLVLLAIADHANDDGWAYPGQQSLAQKCSVSDRAVRTSISQLVEAGLLEAHRRGRMRTNLYRVTLDGTRGDRKDTSSHPEPGDRKHTSSSDRKPTSSMTGSTLPGNHQGTIRRNQQQVAVVHMQWAARWAELRGIPATETLLNTWGSQVASFMAAGGQPTEQLLSRAHSRGIEQPAGWPFAVEGAASPWPGWLPGHLLKAAQHPDSPVDPRWEREYTYGPQSPVPAEKQPAITAKARLLRLARDGEHITEATVQQVLEVAYNEGATR